MAHSILGTHPLRVLINGEDFSQIVDQGMQWSNADPGGYEAATIPVPRDCPELQVGQPIRIETGLQTAWEGRIGQIQRSLGNRTIVTGEGYGAVLKDYDLGMVYVDRDLARWQSPSTSRQLTLAAANFQLGSAQTASDPTNLLPSVCQQISDTWGAPYEPTVESWYDSGSENLIASIYYNVIASAGAGFTDTVNLSSDDVGSIIEASGNLFSGGGLAGYFTPATAYRFAILSHLNSTTPGGTSGLTVSTFWRNLAVYGNHGLTGRGTDPVGFYPTDIANHALSQLPSGLIVPGIVPDFTSFIVPHYVQYTPVAIEQIVADMGGLAGIHWGTWESLTPLSSSVPRFDFRPYPTSPTCWALRQDCDTLDINEQLAGLYDTVQVTYTSPAGVQMAQLVQLDNPYLDAVGLHRCLELNMGQSTPSAAATFGGLVLALSQTQARASGSATLTGLVSTPTGQMPPWLLKAGIDRFRVPDLPGQGAFGTTNDFAIRRVSCSVTPEGVATTLELGQGANLLEVLQARLQTVSTLAAVA